jgi:hypothetical protein
MPDALVYPVDHITIIPLRATADEIFHCTRLMALQCQSQRYSTKLQIRSKSTESPSGLVIGKLVGCVHHDREYTDHQPIYLPQ